MELHTQMEYAGTVRDVHNINGFVYSDYTIHPAFAINEEQIKQVSDGVKKIRLVTTTDYRDKEFKKDKIGVAIKAQYELIQESSKKRLVLPTDFKSVYNMSKQS